LKARAVAPANGSASAMSLTSSNFGNKPEKEMVRDGFNLGRRFGKEEEMKC